MEKKATFGVLFILTVLAISGYVVAQELEQREPETGIEYKTAESWTITLNFDKKYFEKFGISNAHPRSVGMKMACEFKDRYEGTCNSLGYINLKRIEDDTFKNCILPIRFTLEISPKWLGWRGTKAIMTECIDDYAKGNLVCPIDFFRCQNKKSGKVNIVSKVPVSIGEGKTKLRMYYSKTNEYIEPVLSWSAKKTGTVTLIKNELGLLKPYSFEEA
ncbi:MAG: hypothetical protein KKE23_02540 [Nanoarchaeota archaeon]|nr:hypothetical protein [Nanoarchaeota archaeon]